MFVQMSVFRKIHILLSAYRYTVKTDGNGFIYGPLSALENRVSFSALA